MQRSEETMDVKADILALENKFWQSMIDKDVDAASRLVADECIVTGAQGAARIDKASFTKMMRDGKWELHAYSFDDVSVISPSPDIAVIGYKVSERVTVDGQEIQFQAADASTWVKRTDTWLCVLHAESVIGDPFGRDRGGKEKT
jgi:ketosteroid isomerase-like protein